MAPTRSPATVTEASRTRWSRALIPPREWPNHHRPVDGPPASGGRPRSRAGAWRVQAQPEIRSGPGPGDYSPPAMAEPAYRSPPPLFQAVVLDPIRAFTQLEASGGIVLFVAAVVAF